MASYGTIYQFSFDSVNGADIDIFILKKNYTGARQQRALGRAPVLKRERSGSIFGTSLEIYAECLVDGEFAQLYTSSADEYKVEVYKHQELIWTGFVSPELYSEPDIAPPYDVQIIATDGLGELKNYTFEAMGEKSLKDHLLSLMAHTGLDLPYMRVTTLDYTDGDGAEFFWYLLVDLDYLEGKNCYDVLKILLDSTHAQMTQQDAAWLIARECDYAHLASVNGVDGYEGDNAVVLPVASFGSMQSHKWWPVGQLITTIHPAYKGMTIESERTYKASILQNSDMTYMGGWEAIAEGVTFLTDEGGYALKQAEAAIRQDVNIGILDRGLTLNVSAMLGDGGDGQDDKKLLIYIYALDGTSWVMMYPDGSYWGVGAGPVEMELNDNLSNIDVNIPVNASFSAIRVVLKSAGGWHKIVKSCHLRQSYMPKGEKVALTLANGARGEADDVSVELSNKGIRDYIYRYAVIRDSRLDTAVKVTTYDFPEGSFLDSLMARDYAKSIALPRMKITGVLNVPADGYMPVLFIRDDTFYIPQTYNYDLYNDEVSVELLSIPTAVISVESEKVTELDNASSGGSVGGGGSSGGPSGGGGTANATVDTEMSDTSVNAVQNKVIKAYVDSVDSQLQEEINTKAEARIIHVNMSSANEQIAEQKAYNADTYKKIVAGEKLYLLYPVDAGYWMLTPIANSNGVISLERSTTDGFSAYVTTVQLSEDGTTTVSMAITSFPSYQIDSEMSDTSDGLVPNKIIKKYVDDAVAGAGAVIFDATSSTDPWSLNVLQTSTTIEEIVEAINNGSPIYMRFGSGLVAVDNAELYENGDVSLYVHLVDSESELIRTIHAYSTTDGGWTWESFDNPMGGSANPDEEDITTNEEGKLQFKDRGNADGMGYVILRKGKALSEQMKSTNTIYEVRYDFDLATGVVEMPAGSILKFNGGCISNGTLKGSNSQIDAEPVKIFDSITFTGSWMADAIYAEWWGAEGLYSRASYANEAYAPQALVIPSAVNNLPDSSAAINAALAFSSLTGGEVCLQGLVYRTTDTIVMDRYSTLKMQSETTIVPYLTGAGTLVVTHNVDDLTMTEEALDAPALTLARNQIIDTSSMAIAIKVNPVRTKLYGAGLLCLQKSRYTIGVCITSEGRHLMDMTYLTPSIDIVTVGDNRLTYAPDPRDIIGSGAPSASVGSGNTETIYYWDKTNKAYYSRSAGASSWSLVSSASDPKWNTSLRFDIGNKKTARLINPQVTIKDIFGARGIEVYMRVPSDYVDMPFFNHSTIKGSLSEKYSHYFSIFNEKGCSFDLHDWKDVVVQHSPINMYESSTFFAASGSGVEIGMIWDLKWLGSKSEVDFFLGKNTRKNTFMTSDGGVVVDLGVDNVFGEKKATAAVSGGAIPRIEMTASSAELAPNTFYVWNMADSLNLTLADGDTAVMNKYLFQFRNPVDSVTMLTLPDDITWSEDTELDENRMPVMEATAFYRIEIIEGFASLKKWKLAYIVFADAEVEGVLMANGVGDGLGITKVDAKKVSRLKKWFNGNTVIKSFEELQFFTSVIEIEYQAFKGCSELERIDLRNVAAIRAEAFNGCTKMSQFLELPVCGSIGNNAFNGCVAITGLNAPQATLIDGSNFYLCVALTYVNIPSAQEVRYRAFMGCTALEEIVTGSALTVVGAEAFRDCSIMTGYINVENVTSLGNAAFTGCSALTQDMHLKSLAGAVTGSFRGSGIRSLALPLATSASAYQHFMNCKNLKYVLYGELVASIGTAQVFTGCTALEAIIILNATPPTLYSTGTLARPTNCPIYVPDASVEAYKGAINFTGNASYIKGISDLQSENPTIYAEIQQYL